MMPQQDEMNRRGQSKREHRRAALPRWVTGVGTLTDEEKLAIGMGGVGSVTQISGMTMGQKISDILQAVPIPPIDPELHESQSIMQDVMLSVGAQEATFGSVSGSTATEASIAEGNRTEADVDELNDFLTEIARDAGQILLMEVGEEQAKRIAGPGAVWPKMDTEDIIDEIYLSVVAGSNGRPNKAANQYALQQTGPLLLQVPSVNPTWFAKQLVGSLDDSIDMEEAITAGLPSILSMAQMMQPATGDPATSPEQQGGKGKDNGKKPERQDNKAEPPMGGPRAQV
jgi:hypothetical protein